ncbi:MAG: response regulator transcription factor [Acetatifactor sp.]|nr:response regulator transcription factor [Acetatifactor sp.]
MKYQIATWNISQEYTALLSPILYENGITLIEVQDSETLNQLISDRQIHLILADVFEPDDTTLGLSQITELQSMCRLPLIIFSQKDDLMTKITALDIGADEFVCSGISILELQARISALLRRTYQLPGPQVSEKPIYTVRELKLNDESKKTYVDGKEKKLTPIEYRILKLLITKKGRPVSSEEIYKTIWKMNAVNTENVIAVHMRHIRKKIEAQPDNPSYLKVVRGMGYMIV